MHVLSYIARMAVWSWTQGGCRQPDETPDRPPAGDPGHLGSDFVDLNEKRILLEELEREAKRQEEEVRLETLRVKEFEARQSDEAANVAEHGAELHEEQQKIEREHEALVKAYEEIKAKQLALDKRREQAKEENAGRAEAARASMEKERGEAERLKREEITRKVNAARLEMEKKAALEKEEAARRADAAARSEMEKRAALEKEEAARKEETARMEMETKAALEKEEAARRAEAAARLEMEKKAALEKEEAARKEETARMEMETKAALEKEEAALRAEAAARSEMEKKAALEEEEAARKEEQARKAALALQGELEQEELAQKRLVREKEKAAYRAQQERERQLAGQEKSAPAVAASEAKDDEEKTKVVPWMPSVQKRCCCWNSKWLSFRKKYGNPRNKLWNWRKESSQSCQRAAKQQPGPGHYVFCMHACMLDFFPYDIYICFCRTEIEGSPAKACMCMHASKLNANGISRIAVHIMHALNIYIYIYKYYILYIDHAGQWWNRWHPAGWNSAAACTGRGRKTSCGNPLPFLTLPTRSSCMARPEGDRAGTACKKTEDGCWWLEAWTLYNFTKPVLTMWAYFCLPHKDPALCPECQKK